MSKILPAFWEKICISACPREKFGRKEKVGKKPEHRFFFGFEGKFSGRWPKFFLLGCENCILRVQKHYARKFFQKSRKKIGFAQKQFGHWAKFFLLVVKTAFFLSREQFWTKKIISKFFKTMKFLGLWAKNFSSFWKKFFGRVVETAFLQFRGTFSVKKRKKLSLLTCRTFS